MCVIAELNQGMHTPLSPTLTPTRHVPRAMRRKVGCEIHELHEYVSIVDTLWYDCTNKLE